MTIKERVREARAARDGARLALHDAKNEAWQSSQRLSKMLDPYEHEAFNARLVSDFNRLADAVQTATLNLQHADEWLQQVSRLARDPAVFTAT